MKRNTLTGILMPAILILLQACAGSRVNSSHPPTHAAASLPEINGEASPGDQVYRNDIHIKAVRHFKKTYPGAEDERWYVIKNGFMAKYKVDDTPIRLDYDRYGNWLYTIRYITEKKLPREVRALVRSTWYDYAISSAEEILYREQYIYILHIREGNNWKLIRVSDGEMMEMQPPGSAG